MLTNRIIGALTFRRGVYAEVEADKTFTATAWTLVVILPCSIGGSTPPRASLTGWWLPVSVC
jgi:hypothetical protein